MNTFHLLCNFLCGRSLQIIGLFILGTAPTIQLWAMRGTDTESRNWYILISILILVSIALFVLYKFKVKALVSAKAFWSCIAASILFNLILNPEVSQQTHQFPNALLMTSGLIFATYAILRRFFFILWIPVLFCLTVQYCALSIYGIELNATTIAQIFNATNDELNAYLTSLNLTLIVAFIIISSGICYLIFRTLRQEHSLSLLSTSAICLAVLYCGRYYTQPVYYNQDCGLWPLKHLRQLSSMAVHGAKENEIIRNMVYSLPSSAKAPSSSNVLNGNEGLIVVLHIGESAMSTHFSLNGYERNTTPFLLTEKNLINFKDCTASSIYTVYSMVTLLTNGRRGYNFCSDKEMQPNVTSFSDLMIKHDFKLYCLFSHGTMIHTAGQNTLPKILHKLTEGASAIYSNTGLPMEQIQLLKEVLSSDHNTNKFILINNEGSHVPFNFYDSATAAYSPTLNGGWSGGNPDSQETARKIINSYDNTINYTDDYIKNAIRLLKGKPYIYIYISDHGECLGDAGYWGRAAASNPNIFFATSACKVPFFILYSTEIQKLHPHFEHAISQLKMNASLRTAHEHIFHTILGIVGISSPHYQASLDLSSPQAKPYSGPHPDDNKDQSE